MVKTSDLIRFSSDAAFAVDKNLCVVGWNESAQALLGYVPGEVEGRFCGDVLQAFFSSGEPLCSAYCNGGMCFLRGEPFSVPACRLRHKDGSMVDAGISTLVVPQDDDTDDNVVALILIHGQNSVASRAQALHPLRIFTLGHFCLAVSGAGLAVDKWRRKQALTLLKCLVINLGRPVHRERLIEYIWPDCDADTGWERLKVTVYFLRSQLRASGLSGEIVETVGKSYLLRRDAVWVDVNAFESLVAEGGQHGKEGRVREALRCYGDARQLYRGDYMEDDLYADWCAEERERLHEVFLELLAGSARCHAVTGAYADAAEVCRFALSRDPCRETFLQMLIEYLGRQGKRDTLESQFNHWRGVLQEQFAIAPMPETLALYRRHLNDLAKRPVS